MNTCGDLRPSISPRTPLSRAFYCRRKEGHEGPHKWWGKKYNRTRTKLEYEW